MVPMGQDGHSSGAPGKFTLRKNTNAPIAGWTQQNEIALLFEGPKNAGLYAIPAEGGQEIAYTTGDRIWKVARGGGEPKEIRIGLQGSPAQIAWSPDGKRPVIAFGKGGETELWLMTSFSNAGSESRTPIHVR